MREPKPTKPKTFQLDNLSKLPAALAPLTKMRHWVVWRWEYAKDKWTKVPYQPSNPNLKARNNDPKTWDSYEAAVKAKNNDPSLDGIGFNLLNSGYGGIDLDKCGDYPTKKINPWATDMLARAPATYVEFTVSGAGLRVIGRITGKKPGRDIPGMPDGGKFELYRGGARYITISGLALDGRGDGDLSEITGLLDELDTEYPAGGEKRGPGRSRGQEEPEPEAKQARAGTPRR